MHRLEARRWRQTCGNGGATAWG